MKPIITVFIVLLMFNFSINPGFAGEGLNENDYTDIYTLENTKSKNWPSVHACLKAWGKHPFKSDASKKFRVIKSSVSVFGLGGSSISDKTKTKYPQLILIRPAVNVMSSSKYELMNPNGWYCFKGQVTVMGKSTINIACKTHIASTKGSVTVLGKSDSNSGTTVMGKTTINRHCKN